jgi:hypothetical protein
VRRLLAPLALVLLAGCGPIKSSRALVGADVEIEAARTAGAERSALYELTAAEAYLHKAREEAGYAQYEVAAGYAAKARDLARAAKEKAAAAKAGEVP